MPFLSLSITKKNQSNKIYWLKVYVREISGKGYGREEIKEAKFYGKGSKIGQNSLGCKRRLEG